jgi:hypothetical protein
MTDAKGPPGKDPEDLQRILRCGKCGKTVACQPSEMLAYTATGWPKCCGETTALLTPPNEPPSSAGSATGPEPSGDQGGARHGPGQRHSSFGRRLPVARTVLGRQPGDPLFIPR